LISRSLIIVLAFLAAGMRATQGAWTETTGLAALGMGLVLLRVAQTRPAFKSYAFTCFAITAVTMVMVFTRTYL
jgi:hypothetical protein